MEEQTLARKIIICGRDLDTSCQETAAVIHGETQNISDVTTLHIAQGHPISTDNLKETIEVIEQCEKMEADHREKIRGMLREALDEYIYP